jgi:hypothetical protein
MLMLASAASAWTPERSGWLRWHPSLYLVNFSTELHDRLSGQG